ncbi:hypothetical protein HYT95_01050 [Candidatus Peregrinibacteria bacterium]|nr:hypothetical protein [Candidatus Peregrinibacteria bacterium]
MKILQALAQATIETARTIPKKDLPALADAVLRLLRPPCHRETRRSAGIG